MWEHSWRRKLAILSNFLLHTWQANGRSRSPVWIRKCLCNFDATAKLFVQRLHLKARLPEWFRSCTCKFEDWLKLLLQNLQTYGRSPVWMRSCRRRLNTREKLLPQYLHTQGWRLLRLTPSRERNAGLSGFRELSLLKMLPDGWGKQSPRTSHDALEAPMSKSKPSTFSPRGLLPLCIDGKVLCRWLPKGLLPSTSMPNCLAKSGASLIHWRMVSSSTASANDRMALIPWVWKDALVSLKCALNVRIQVKATEYSSKCVYRENISEKAL